MKLSDIKAGDVIMVDDGFVALQAGPHIVGEGQEGPFIINGHGECVRLAEIGEDADGNIDGVLRKVC